MTDTLIMSMDFANRGNRLYLVGGENIDWDNTAVETLNCAVWSLSFNNSNKTYHWDSSIIPPLGE